ncbi:MAG: alpha-hydroxy-acid oxidizing protein [Anaerolineae bacterium]|nr:alpha-hydroxy-acid oxidizing protein [Anaerolineae bacterium]
MVNLETFIEVLDFERHARDALTQMAYDYYASGANDQVTLAENRAAFERLRLLPRMLVDVSRLETTTTVLGQPLSVPFMIAPTAFQRMAHPDGEVATSRAARAQNVAMVVSTIASATLEEVAGGGATPRWFQLYVYKDRGITRSLVERAEAAGYSALVLTVDTPKFGRRYADVRNHFHLPPGLTVANLTGAGMERLSAVKGESGLAAYSASLFDPSLTWDDVEWLRSSTRLPVLVKGVLRPDDALRALDRGVSALVVSNHGGRQLDGVPASITALPGIVAAVEGRCDILLDGGIRRGTDILKALALGARAVLVGRPILWGLAAGGQAGVERVLHILREELELAMMLAGCPTVRHIKRDLVDDTPA